MYSSVRENCPGHFFPVTFRGMDSNRMSQVYQSMFMNSENGNTRKTTENTRSYALSFCIFLLGYFQQEIKQWSSEIVPVKLSNCCFKDLKLFRSQAGFKFNRAFVFGFIIGLYPSKSHAIKENACPILALFTPTRNWIGEKRNVRVFNSTVL